MNSNFVRSLAWPPLLAFAAGIMLLASGCASEPRVHANYDTSADFSRYTTFGFASPLGTDRAGYRSIVSQYLTASARRELELHGLHYAETAPQLIVNFNARLSDKLRSDTTPVSGGYYGYRRGYYGAWPMYSETTVSTYTEGTLNIDIVDAARKQMVWEGVAVGTVTDKTVENLQPVLDNAVTKMLANYPTAGSGVKK